MGRIIAVGLLSLVSACASAIHITERDPTPDRVSAQALTMSRGDHRGQPFDLGRTIGEKPTIVIFYRGHW